MINWNDKFKHMNYALNSVRSYEKHHEKINTNKLDRINDIKN
jgi:hypothetical protein